MLQAEKTAGIRNFDFTLWCNNLSQLGTPVEPKPSAHLTMACLAIKEEPRFMLHLHLPHDFVNVVCLFNLSYTRDK